MATTQEDIRGWLREAQRQRATHLVVACDTFSHEDYPIYVRPGQSVHTIVVEHNGPNMQKVMEVYAMHLPLEDQLREHRAWHLDGPAEEARQREVEEQRRASQKKKVPKKKPRKTVWSRLKKPEI